MIHRITIPVLVLALTAGGGVAGTFVPDYVAGPSSQSSPLYTDIAVDAAGAPHVAYTCEYSGGNADLCYAYLDDGDWQRVSTHVGTSINQCAVALDGSGVPHFVVQSGNALGWLPLLFTYNGGTWSSEAPEAGVYDECSGGWPDIVIDSGDTPWISYYWKADDTSSEGDLRLAYKSGGTWYVETVDGGAADVGEYTSIALSALERPRISYYDRTNGNLMYARRSGTGDWTLELVDDLADVGTWSSIAVGPDGDIHICYRNEVTAALRYARRTDGVWTTEAIPDNHSTGDGLSIAVDAAGDPHISYYHIGLGRLRHIWKTGGVWNAEIVDDTGDRGLRSAIALAQDGTPHVSYVQEPDQQIWYATYDPGVAVPDGPPPAHALSVYPNPAGGGAPVRIEYAAADKADTGGPVELCVYDLAGRRVRTLITGGPASGSVQWDGRTEGGAPAPAGTYLVRCAGGGGVVTRRVQVVR